jgi:glycosyltransferase involved in cell wall biosynthesis
MLIQNICDFYKIDAFTSTYYTTPINTPMLLMVYDMIPEIFDFDLTVRGWMEKEIAISYAQRYLCISHNTRNDLLTFYPEIPDYNVSVAHCGIDRSTFYSRTESEIVFFKKKFECQKPFFLFVGSRTQHNGYKNSKIFFDAFLELGCENFDILCVGGEKEIDPEILERLHSNVSCKRVELTDDELGIAYSSAHALVYPSLYEGFGMPVIEAMACGCPVITTHHGSLAEAAGDAACLISGTSMEEMKNALIKISDPNYRQILRTKGIEQAGKFNWETMAQILVNNFEILLAQARSGKYEKFFSDWKRLRTIQAEVDFLV